MTEKMVPVAALQNLNRLWEQKFEAMNKRMEERLDALMAFLTPNNQDRYASEEEKKRKRPRRNVRPSSDEEEDEEEMEAQFSEDSDAGTPAPVPKPAVVPNPAIAAKKTVTVPKPATATKPATEATPTSVPVSAWNKPAMWATKPGTSATANQPSNKATPTKPTTQLPASGRATESQTVTTDPSCPTKVDGSKVPVPGKQRIPPIILQDSKHFKNIANLLREKKCDFQAKTIANGRIRILMPDSDTFRSLTRVLTAQKVEFFHYSLPEDRPLRVIIRGVDTMCTEEEVMEGLREQGITAHQVSRLHRKRFPMPLVLVVLPTAQEEAVFKINRLCDLVVKVEKAAPPKETSQCHRCQGFHHSQRFCHLTQRCVKCGETHFTQECQKSRDLPAKCANCGESHPANYRGCKKFPKKPTNGRTNRPHTQGTSQQHGRPSQQRRQPTRKPEQKRRDDKSRARDSNLGSIIKGMVSAMEKCKDVSEIMRVMKSLSESVNKKSVSNV